MCLRMCLWLWPCAVCYEEARTKVVAAVLSVSMDVFAYVAMSMSVCCVLCAACYGSAKMHRIPLFVSLSFSF